MGLMKEVKLIGDINIEDATMDSIKPDTGSDLLIEGVTGKDVKFKLTDASGARKIIVLDSADAEVCSIDSNGLVTTAAGLAGPVTGNVTGNLIGNITPSGADVSIIAAAAKDVIVKLGDAEAAKKLLIKDSANAEQASIDSDGTLTAKKIVGNLEYATAEAAPSQAGMISAFGAIATNAGFVGVYKDSTASTGKTWIITCDGAKYFAVDAGTALS